MLQSIRDNMKGTVAVIIIGLMVIPLALFGVSSIFQTTASDPTVASVNGEEITQTDLQREIFFQKERMKQQFGDSLPESFLADENLRGPAMESLITRELWLQSAKDGGMAVPNERVDRLIVDSQEFQLDGQFSSDMFRLRANNMGYTAAGYREMLKGELLRNQVTAGLAASSFMTDADLRRTAALSQQSRDFYYLTVPIAPLEASIEISDEQALAYYQENRDDYLNPEQVVIEYIELELQDIAANIDIPETLLREQYEQEAQEFIANPERRAAHILIEPKDDGSEQAVLQEIQNRLAAGDEFDELAQEYSEDLGSSSSGGDLGFTTGDTFPEAFEDALANLEEGGVSEPVQTDAGFHIIKLVEVRSEAPPTFEESRDRIARVLKQNQAEDEFVELYQQLEEMTYSADNLSEAADTLALSVQTSAPFGRNGGVGIAANPTVVETAYSDDILVEGNNSHLLELSPDHMVVLRLKEHLPERVLDFDEVKERIVAQLKSEESRKQLRELGQNLQQAVRDGQSIEEIAKENGYEWQVSLDTVRTEPKVRRELLDHVFSLQKPAPEDSIVSGIISNSGDYMVVELTGVEEGDFSSLAESEQRSLRQRLAGIHGDGTYAAYGTAIREQADVEIEE